jgi:homoserine acetyltransferase
VSVENPIGRLDLDEGGSIPDRWLAATRWGELNEARDNAILVTAWYSGTHQIWRDLYVGSCLCVSAFKLLLRRRSYA